MNIAFFVSSLTFIIHKVRSSVESRVKRATAMLNLEMETLKSELERTKLMLVGETKDSMEDKELLLKMEVETLKSELEKTKLKVKEVQEVMIGQIFSFYLLSFSFFPC